MTKLSMIVGFIVFFVLSFTIISYIAAMGCSVRAVEVSNYENKGDKALITVRIYIVNDAPVPAKINDIKLYIYDHGTFRGYDIGYVTVPARHDKIIEYQVEVSASEVKDKIRLEVEWSYPLTVFFLYDLYNIETKYEVETSVLTGKYFIWAGWNTTYISSSKCTSYIVRTNPPTSFTLSIYKEIAGFGPRLINEIKGEGILVDEFCPPEPSGLRTKGYFLEVRVEDVTWRQPEGYPPRLYVRP